MKQERFMVINNQKKVLIPLQEENTYTIETNREIKHSTEVDLLLDEKVNKMHKLIKLMVKQSIQETIKEYNKVIVEELKLYEKEELKRWDKLEKAELQHLEKLEKEEICRWEMLEEQNKKRWEWMEEKEEQRLKQLENKLEKHFKTLDKNIRQKQEEGKRKKHSIF